MCVLKDHIRNLARALARFARARDGNIAITFAIALIPMLAFVGAAVDFSRANSIKPQCRRRSMPPR
jgi:Flp pilus assembly protein TadG